LSALLLPHSIALQFGVVPESEPVFRHVITSGVPSKPGLQPIMQYWSVGTALQFSEYISP
jgi:hypothetical protein